jgi:PAS domain S-box-containing protein
VVIGEKKWAGLGWHAAFGRAVTRLPSRWLLFSRLLTELSHHARNGTVRALKPLACLPGAFLMITATTAENDVAESWAHLPDYTLEYTPGAGLPIATSVFRVLMVEDSAADARQIREYLQDTEDPVAPGATVRLTLARDLRSAAETLSSGGGNLPGEQTAQAFDAVLLDLTLPDAAGLDAVRRLRAAAPDLPIVVLTGLAEGSVASRALRLGAQDYLLKEDLATAAASGGAGRFLVRSVRHAVERAAAAGEVRRQQAARLHAEAERRRVDRRFADAFRGSPLPICVTTVTDGRFLDANGAFLALFGYSREEVVGRSIYALDLWARPDERERVLAPLSHAAQEAQEAETPTLSNVEVEVRTRTGEHRPVLASVAFDADGEPAVLTTLLDVTERRRTEERLRVQAALLDAVGEAVIATDPDGTITYWYRAAEDLYGWTAEEARGRTTVELIAPWTTAEQAAAIADARRRGGRWSGEYTVRRRDGTVFSVHVTTTTLTGERGPAGVIGVSTDLTERKRTEAALAASERRLSLVLESVSEGITIVNSDGRVTFANAAAERVLGLRRSEVTALTYDAPAWKITAVDGGPFPHDELPFVRVMRTGEAVFDVRHAIEHPDGTRVVLSINAVPKRDPDGTLAGMVASMRDITVQVEAEREAEHGRRALAESERRFRALIEKSADAVSLVSADGMTLYTSPAGERIHGFALHERLVVPVWETIHPDDQVRAMTALRAVLAAPAASGAARFRWRHKDGSWRWIDATGTNLVDDPAVGAVVVNYRDVTEGVNAETALRHANARLAGALEELQTAQDQVVQQERLRALGQMAAGVAHDLNNALAPVVGFGDLLLEAPGVLEDPERVRRFVELIRTGAQDAAAVVARMRAFYRPREAGDDHSAVDVVALAHQVLALTRPKWKDQALAAGATIDAVVESSSGPVPPVLGNESELREALTNLVFNAVDAMPGGGTLTLRAFANGPCVVLEVADTGAGMTEEQRRRCLEPFFTTKGERGSGLGLPMVHGTVRRHGGKLAIESQPGRGTVVRLTFPVAAPDPRHVARVGAGTDDGPGRRVRVLVVDDEPEVRGVTVAFLTVLGHDVAEDSDAREALDALDAGPGLCGPGAGGFDLVITDKAMPGMNGEQLAREIAARAPGLPVLLLTGFGALMDAAERPEGVAGVLAKPITLAALRAALAPIVASAAAR